MRVSVPVLVSVSVSVSVFVSESVFEIESVSASVSVSVSVYASVLVSCRPFGDCWRLLCGIKALRSFSKVSFVYEGYRFSLAFVCACFVVACSQFLLEDIQCVISKHDVCARCYSSINGSDIH